MAPLPLCAGDDCTTTSASSTSSSSCRRTTPSTTTSGSYCTAPTGSNPTCTSGPGCCEAGPATEPARRVAGRRSTTPTNGAYDPQPLPRLRGRRDQRRRDGPVRHAAGRRLVLDAAELRLRRRGADRSPTGTSRRRRARRSLLPAARRRRARRTTCTSRARSSSSTTTPTARTRSARAARARPDARGFTEPDHRRSARRRTASRGRGTPRATRR